MTVLSACCLTNERIVSGSPASAYSVSSCVRMSPMEGYSMFTNNKPDSITNRAARPLIPFSSISDSSDKRNDFRRAFYILKHLRAFSACWNYREIRWLDPWAMAASDTAGASDRLARGTVSVSQLCVALRHNSWSDAPHPQLIEKFLK